MAKRIAFLVAAVVPAAVALAAPGGQLDTLPRGKWQCATPGLAGEQPIRLREELGFRIVNPSSYIHDGERGTYLNTGDQVVFTSGNMRGARFQRMSANMIRERAKDGTLGELRCVRLGY